MTTETNTIFVQFADETPPRIIAVFFVPQDPEYWPGLIEMQEDDPRYQAYLHPELQPAAILKAKQDQKDALLAAASQSMARISVSLQLGDATDAETMTAKAWQAYYRALTLVDITVDSPVWPVPPAQ
ncbi:tail fiber assembly protein [Pseudomonas sp. PCH446]